MTGPAGLRRFVTGTQQTATSAAGVSPAAAGVSPAAAEAAAAALPDTPEVLERIRASKGPAAAPGEACELCAAVIPSSHGHVADLEQSSLLCTCRACYLLFTHGQAGGGRYKAVPDRYLHDPARPMSAAEWDELEIPVGLAFFMHSSQAGQVTGFYPSPAGATECRLDLSAWERLARAHPLLAAIEPDVEAALIARGDKTSLIEHFVVPIDACYELAGRMRMLWKGFDGGTEARQSIDEFLDDVRSHAREFSAEPS